MTMACVGEVSSMRAEPDGGGGVETDESDGETTTVKDTVAGKPASLRGKDASVGSAFCQVRTLMWREAWLKQQIEVLSRQTDEALANLERVVADKQGHPLLPPRPDCPQYGYHMEGAEEDQIAAGAATPRAEHLSEKDVLTEDARGGRCARMENWGMALVGRRRLLIEALVPLSTRELAPPQQYDPKRGRASAFNQVAYKPSFKRGESDEWELAEHFIKDEGSVTAGGRKLVTATGQKLVIKFSGKADSPRSTGNLSPALGSRTPRSFVGRPGQLDKRPHKAIASFNRNSPSPRLGPSTPTTPRSADWGIDDYVYGGPRTHTKIETVQAKEIYTPKWIILDHAVKKGGGKYSKASKQKESAVALFPVTDEGSSSENTDDETYLTRHRPYEEQEVRFRYPKLIERERKYKEALKREGMGVQPHDVEERYKSLWYSGRSTSERDLSSQKRSEASSGDERSPRPTDKHSKDRRPTPDADGKEPASKARKLSPADSPQAATPTHTPQAATPTPTPQVATPQACSIEGDSLLELDSMSATEGEL